MKSSRCSAKPLRIPNAAQFRVSQTVTRATVATTSGGRRKSWRGSPAEAPRAVQASQATQSRQPSQAGQSRQPSHGRQVRRLGQIWHVDCVQRGGFRQAQSAEWNRSVRCARFVGRVGSWGGFGSSGALRSLGTHDPRGALRARGEVDPRSGFAHRFASSNSRVKSRMMGLFDGIGRGLCCGSMALGGIRK